MCIRDRIQVAQLSQRNRAAVWVSFSFPMKVTWSYIFAFLSSFLQLSISSIKRAISHKIPVFSLKRTLTDKCKSHRKHNFQNTKRFKSKCDLLISCTSSITRCISTSCMDVLIITVTGTVLVPYIYYISLSSMCNWATAMIILCVKIIDITILVLIQISWELLENLTRVRLF